MKERLSPTLVRLTVFLLELPTSGFADAFGRRPVYLASCVVCVVSGIVFYTSTRWWQFVVAAVLTGVFRALDSLESWFVDTVQASEPGYEVGGALARAGNALGSAMAVGRSSPAASCGGTPCRRRTHCCSRANPASASASSTSPS